MEPQLRFYRCRSLAMPKKKIRIRIEVRHFVCHAAFSTCPPNSCRIADRTRSAKSSGLNSDLGRNCRGVPLVDTHFIVMSLPAIAAGPEERELQGSNLIAVDGDIGEFNSDSGGS